MTDSDKSSKVPLIVEETDVTSKSKLVSNERPDTQPSKFLNGKKGAKTEEEPEERVRTKEEKQASFRFIMQYAKQECGSITLGILFLVGGSLSDLTVPLFVGRVIDLMQKGEFDKIGMLCLYMLIVITVSAICVGFRAAIFNILSERIARNLRKDFYESMVHKDIAFYDERRTGDFLSRLNSDIQVVQDSLSTNISMFVRGSIFIIIVLILLCVISLPLTGVTLLGIMPLVLFAIFYARWMRTLQKQIQDQKGLMNTTAEESFANIRTVKAFSNEANETGKFGSGNEIVYQAGRTKAIYQAFFAFMTQFLLYAAMAAVIYTSSILYQNNQITIGEISAFLFYMIMLIFNFAIVGMVFGNVAATVGASDKIVELMQYKPDINTTGGATTVEGEVNGVLEVRDVKFSYPSKSDVEVLKGISIEVNNIKNRVVALCGTSGCGKSSIISLIERFYDPQSGGIFFNGKDIRTLEPRWYHNQIAIVQQEPVLFSGTIRENICYGLEIDEQQTAAELETQMDDACRQANAYDFIHDLAMFPEGYETIVGERGVKLSGGQKQRVAIARALIRKPKLLLLDEATSALDAESEHQVQQALDSLIKSGKQTVLIVAHRLSTIRDANEIIVMAKGEVKERGTHTELLARNGAYRALVERQLVNSDVA